MERGERLFGLELLPLESSLTLVSAGEGGKEGGREVERERERGKIVRVRGRERGKQ